MYGYYKCRALIAADYNRHAQKYKNKPINWTTHAIGLILKFYFYIFIIYTLITNHLTRSQRYIFI